MVIRPRTGDMPANRADGAATLGPMRISLVVSTLGRFDEVRTFLESLAGQPATELEAIVVDQNDDDRLARACRERDWPFPLIYRHEPGMRGVCRGRNLGASLATGDLLCFPDDDCTYPPDLLARVRALFVRMAPDILTGPAADVTGRSINGRFRDRAQWITRANAFQTSIEWMMFFRREAFETVGGFAEDLGPGSGSPWMANEGQDIVLRALAQGYRAYYSPAVYGHHPELTVERMGSAMSTKARGYGRGMGYVLGRHGYRVPTVAWLVLRPAVACVLFAARGNFRRASYYVQSARGRVEGYLDGCRRRYVPKYPAPAANLR